jgi:hypothetical protein
LYPFVSNATAALLTMVRTAEPKHKGWVGRQHQISTSHKANFFCKKALCDLFVAV